MKTQMERYHYYQRKQKKKAKHRPENQEELEQIKEHVLQLGMENISEYMKWCKEHKFRTSMQKSQRELWEERRFYSSLSADGILKKHSKVKNIPKQILSLSKGTEQLTKKDPPVLRALSNHLKMGKNAMDHLQNRFLYHIAKESDLLSSVEFVKPVSLLVMYSKKWIRDFEDWKAQSRNLDKQYFSLINHLFTKYPVPRFIANEFVSGDKTIIDLFIHIGYGYSIRKFGGLKVRLTKKVAHYFMQAPDDCTVYEAVQWAQTTAMGGSPALAQAVRGALIRISQQQQPFWQSVIQFFIDHPSLPYSQFGPVVDYIRTMKYESERVIYPGGRIAHFGPEKPHFSMKGRTPKTLLLLVEKWHTELNKKSKIANFKWYPLGIQAGYISEGKAEKFNLKFWKIIELLNGKELAAEGRAHSHCVATYARKCLRGQASIWSMYCNEERLLTIEVRPENYMIVQIRGKRNRRATEKELKIIRRWAGSNGLKIAAYA